MLTDLLVTVAIGLGTALAVTGLLVRLPVVLDRPGARSLHVKPVPRTGGAGIACGVLVAGIFAVPWPEPEFVALSAGWLVVLAVSFIDDLHHVPAPMRLAAHFVAAGILLSAVGQPAIGVLVVVAVALVWGINLFNFMDGADGLAGTMAVFGGFGLATLCWQAGDSSLAMTSVAIAAASAGFLVWNLPPARIFMGDAGSAGLGFLFGGLSWIGISRGLFSWESAVILFLPFIIDASLTLLIRILHRNKVWQAHREHLYQRLVVAAGWPVKRVLVLESGIMLACLLASLVAFMQPQHAGRVLAGVAGILVAGYFLLQPGERSK